MTTKTFRDAYEVLQRHAQTLREQDEPNIDDLLDIVTESVEAYKVCQSRIDAVEQALAQALERSGVDAATTRGPLTDAQPPALPRPPRPAPPARPGTGFDDMDDDIPF